MRVDSSSQAFRAERLKSVKKRQADRATDPLSHDGDCGTMQRLPLPFNPEREARANEVFGEDAVGPARSGGGI